MSDPHLDALDAACSCIRQLRDPKADEISALGHPGCRVFGRAILRAREETSAEASSSSTATPGFLPSDRKQLQGLPEAPPPPRLATRRHPLVVVLSSRSILSSLPILAAVSRGDLLGKPAVRLLAERWLLTPKWLQEAVLGVPGKRQKRRPSGSRDPVPEVTVGDAELQHYMHGWDIDLVLFARPASSPHAVFRGTWRNVLAAASRRFPERAESWRAAAAALPRVSLASLESEFRERHGMRLQHLPRLARSTSRSDLPPVSSSPGSLFRFLCRHPAFPSDEASLLAGLCDDGLMPPCDVRFFLFAQWHLTEGFRGDGNLYDTAQERFAEEWLALDVHPIAPEDDWEVEESPDVRPPSPVAVPARSVRLTSFLRRLLATTEVRLSAGAESQDWRTMIPWLWRHPDPRHRSNTDAEDAEQQDVVPSATDWPAETTEDIEANRRQASSLAASMAYGEALRSLAAGSVGVLVGAGAIAGLVALSKEHWGSAAETISRGRWESGPAKR